MSAPVATAGTSPSSGTASRPSARHVRARSLANLLRMGHCAPSVMQTLLDISAVEAPWLVKLTAGLPGGIGNTGGEFGAVTAPLMLLGLRHGRDTSPDGLPVVIEKAREYMERFRAVHGTVLCRDIRGTARVPLSCAGVVQRAPILLTGTKSTNCGGVLSGQQRAAYIRLWAYWQARQFHCAHAVWRALEGAVPVTPEVVDATTAFVGGTACSGGTCIALTTGVMALGLAQGQIERSRLRVLRMIGTMATGGNAFAEHLNAFNATMNRGHRLARWFSDRFGTTQCRALTGADFSTPADVEDYIARDGVARCQSMAEDVGHEVRGMLTAESSNDPTGQSASRFSPVIENIGSSRSSETPSKTDDHLAPHR